MKFLGTTAPLPASLLRCLEIITATVSSADKFYTDVKTEAIPESCACFLNASGASSERLYSSLINHFGALGGFEMMIQRLLQRVRGLHSHLLVVYLYVCPPSQAPLLIPLHEVEVYVAVFACKRLRGSATLANDIVPRGLEAACLRVIRITSVDEEEVVVLALLCLVYKYRVLMC